MRASARLAAAAAAAACALAAAGRAQAQSVALPEFLQHLGIESWWDVVQFQPWTASLGLTFDDQERRFTSSGASSERSSSRLGTETFSIRNDGIAIIDRRLFTASLLLGLQLAQGRQQGEGTATSTSTRLENYAFTGTFLAERPYMATVSAARNQSLNVLPSGTTTESDNRGSSFQLFVRENNILREKEWFPYFSGSVRAAEERSRQTTTSGSQTFVQDDRRQTALVDFQNGGENADLSFQYQYTKLDNYAYQAGSYRSHAINAYHSIDFGTGLARRLDSRLSWHDRAGATPDSDQTSLEISEFLSIDHNVFRSSTYSYQLARQDTVYGVATTHSATAQILEQVYRNLSAGASVNASRSILPGGVMSAVGASGNFDYSRRLPWNGSLRLAGGAGYSRSATEVPGGVIPVVDEPYAVPIEVGAGSSILLKGRNIDATTVVVVVLKGGARMRAFEGADYSIRIEGDRTRVVPNPASAVMLPGDPLNVSYTYAIEPEAKYATTSRSGTLGLEWGWIGFNASHDQTGQQSLSGTSDLLVDTRRDFAQVYVRGEWEAISARVSASSTDYDSTRLAYREDRLDEYVSYSPMYGFALTFTGNQYRADYRLPAQRTTGASYRIDLQWNSGGWLASSYLGHRTYEDSHQPRETVAEAGVRIRRSWSKLDVSLMIGAQRRERGPVASENAYFHFGAVRRF